MPAEFERGQVVQVDSISLDGRTFVKASGSLEALPPWFTAAASLLPTHAKKEGQIVGRGKFLLIGSRQAVWDSWAITDYRSRVATVEAQSSTRLKKLPAGFAGHK